MNFEVTYNRSTGTITSPPEDGTPPELNDTLGDFVQSVVEWDGETIEDRFEAIAYVANISTEEFHEVLRQIVREDNLRWDTVYECIDGNEVTDGVASWMVDRTNDSPTFQSN
jgi:hypothetical protein